jgi:signal transduction histidine kinase
MRSLALKLIIAFLAVSLVGTILLALLAGRTTANEFGQFVFTRNQELVADELGEYYRDHGGWDGVVNRYESIPGGRSPGMGPGRGFGGGGGIALIDELGRVILAGAGHHVGEKPPPAEVAQGIVVEVDGRPVGTLLVAGPSQFRPTVIEGTFLSRVNQALLLASVGATGVALFLGIFLTRALTRPLRELTAATRAVAKGKLGHQVEVRSQDELGDLADSFNQMSADLARSRDLRRQMTADIAHDLRTPLSVILGHAEALRDGVLPPTGETFHIVHDEALRLSRLVEDLRTLSLEDTAELPLVRRLTPPKRLLERAAATQANRVVKGDITLQVNADPELPDFDIDPDRMAQVLSNLLENALQHTPEGGTIILAAEPGDEGVRLSVHDSGPGIAAEDLPRVFDRFYRADKARNRHDGGSGLGLAIARSIVVKHGGRIWAESEPGEGATIFIELPVDGR